MSVEKAVKMQMVQVPPAALLFLSLIMIAVAL